MSMLINSKYVHHIVLCCVVCIIQRLVSIEYKYDKHVRSKCDDEREPFGQRGSLYGDLIVKRQTDATENITFS